MAVTQREISPLFFTAGRRICPRGQARAKPWTALSAGQTINCDGELTRRSEGERNVSLVSDRTARFRGLPAYVTSAGQLHAIDAGTQQLNCLAHADALEVRHQPKVVTEINH